MKKLVATLIDAIVLAVLAPGASAAATHNATEISDHIARHRATAAAHENAARCLESGKKEEVCDKDLRPACKGPAIGKYCDMKHGH